MNEIDFINNLKVNNSAYDYFLKTENEDKIVIIKNLFEPRIFKTESLFNDPLLRLIDTCEFSPSYLTNISFSSEIEENFNSFEIGLFEGDFILMDKKNHNIFVVNYFIPSQVLYECAKDGFHFLEALYIRLSYRIPESNDEEEIQKYYRIMREKCSIAAGGKKYSAFWDEV
jgi:hypothetical protein